MTKHQFLKSLSLAPVRWRINENGAIRGHHMHENRECCPITALGVEQNIDNVMADAIRLGLDGALTGDIICASENLGGGLLKNSKDIRSELLRATRLL